MYVKLAIIIKECKKYNLVKIIFFPDMWIRLDLHCMYMGMWIRIRIPKTDPDPGV